MGYFCERERESKRERKRGRVEYLRYPEQSQMSWPVGKLVSDNRDVADKLDLELEAEASGREKPGGQELVFGQQSKLSLKRQGKIMINHR